MPSSKTRMIYRVSYSKARDEYSTWIYVGEKKDPDWNDFGLEQSSKCMRAYVEETGEPSKEYCMIHYQLLTGIRQAMQLGYKVEFQDRPEK